MPDGQVINIDRLPFNEQQTIRDIIAGKIIPPLYADANDEKVSAEAEQDGELKRIRTEALTMAQDKEVQNMLIQEKYDRMDWLTYGKEREARGEARGARQQLEEDAKGMYAEGIKPDVIARVQKVSVDVIEKILGLRPV